MVSSLHRHASPGSMYEVETKSTPLTYRAGMCNSLRSDQRYSNTGLRLKSPGINPMWFIAALLRIQPFFENCSVVHLAVFGREDESYGALFGEIAQGFHIFGVIRVELRLITLGEVIE